MGLGAADVVLSPEAAAVLASLEGSSVKTSQAIARRARAYKSTLLADCLHREVAKRDRIPKVLRKRHEVENLYVEDLPSFWRLLYTIVRDRGERYVVVVEIVDHATYTKWFSGRG